MCLQTSVGSQSGAEHTPGVRCSLQPRWPSFCTKGFHAINNCPQPPGGLASNNVGPQLKREEPPSHLSPFENPTVSWVAHPGLSPSPHLLSCLRGKTAQPGASAPEMCLLRACPEAGVGHLVPGGQCFSCDSPQLQLMPFSPWPGVPSHPGRTPPGPAGWPNVVPPSLFPETWRAGRMNLH